MVLLYDPEALSQGLTGHGVSQVVPVFRNSRQDQMKANPALPTRRQTTKFFDPCLNARASAIGDGVKKKKEGGFGLRRSGPD